MLIEKIPEIEVIEENNQIFLKIYMDGRIVNLDTQIIDTEKLGMVRIVEGAFDTPDGNLLTLNMDYFNKKRRKKPAVGPFEGLKPGVNKIKVWG